MIEFNTKDGRKGFVDLDFVKGVIQGEDPDTWEIICHFGEILGVDKETAMMFVDLKEAMHDSEGVEEGFKGNITPTRPPPYDVPSDTEIIDENEDLDDEHEEWEEDPDAWKNN